ncbi:hypothetical protein RyT2_13340 [Pseudolactococcus yaeyamensis]
MQGNLIILRKSNGLTQEDIAKELEITAQSYRNKELGKSEFKQSEMFAIARMFGKELDEIFLDASPRKENKENINHKNMEHHIAS